MKSILISSRRNPQVEAQAIDRVHRYGQSRDVTVYRLIAKDTLDEHILELQEKKLDLFATVLEGTREQVRNDEKPRQLTIDQLRKVFQV